MRSTPRDPAQLTLDDATLRVVTLIDRPREPTAAERDQARLERWSAIMRAFEEAAADDRLTAAERSGWAESAQLLHEERLATRARQVGLAIAG